MNKHIKYHSINNHYMTKEIQYAKKYYDDLFEKTWWSVSEKIHGANISFLLTQDNPIIHFSRNQEIKENSFMNSNEIINQTDKKLFPIQKYVNETGNSVRLFGELFGPGIQKGVDYGPEKRIMFFDIMINDKLLSQKKAVIFMIENNVIHLFVTILKTFKSFEKALEYNTKFNTTYNNIDNNICEGIVIKPWNYVLIDGIGVPFYLKNKNVEFLEKKQKKAKNKKQVRPEVHKWHETFISYIHKERIESVFSKEGRIKSIKELSKFIPLIMMDTSDTFFKEEEFPTNDFDKNEHRYIFNGSKEIVELLKEELGMKVDK